MISPDCREYIHAQTHVDALLETLGVHLHGIDMDDAEQQVSETIEYLSREFLWQFDCNPANPQTNLDPFVMAYYCASVTSKRSEQPPLEYAITARRLLKRIAHLLYGYCHIANTAEFATPCIKDREIAFCMSSHERVGSECKPQSIRMLDSDVIHKICEYAGRGPSSQGIQQKVISDTKRPEYAEFILSRYEIHENLYKTLLVWGKCIIEYRKDSMLSAMA